MILFKSNDFFFISKVPETKNQFWRNQYRKKFGSCPSLHLTNIKDQLFKIVDLSTEDY